MFLKLPFAVSFSVIYIYTYFEISSKKFVFHTKYVKPNKSFIVDCSLVILELSNIKVPKLYSSYS